jgi:hypothetical protein
MVSSEIVSPGAEGLVLFFTVILTARKAVFICGETEVIVPWMIVPSFRIGSVGGLVEHRTHVRGVADSSWSLG